MGVGNWLRRTFGRDRKVVSLSGQPVYMHTERQERPFGMAKVPAAWVESRERYYERWLGPCTYVYHEIIPQIPHIDVCLYPPAPERGRSFHTLITSGMSDLPMCLPDGLDPTLARAEILMYVPSIDVKPFSTQPHLEVEMLRFMARFPFEYETWLAPGHTVPNGNPPQPIAPGSQLTTAFFLAPIGEPEGFNDGLQLDGKPVHFLWLHPITDAECQFKLARGSDALLELMERRYLSPVLNLSRPSLI